MGLGRLLGPKVELDVVAAVRKPVAHPPLAPTSSLPECLDSFLTTVEPSRLQERYLHASSLYGLCTRQVQLLRTQDDAADSVLPPGRRVRFDVGSAVHDLLRQSYLGPLGRLYGEWKCVRCGGLVEGLMPKRCACGAERYDYIERAVRNEEYGIVGHLDGLDKDPLYGLGVLEIKTIDGALFKMLKGPQPEHEFRLHVYMWLAGLTWGRILYVSMAMEKKSPFREFIIRFNVTVVNRVKHVLEELRRGGARTCTARTDPRALGCPVAVRCFSS